MLIQRSVHKQQNRRARLLQPAQLICQMASLAYAKRQCAQGGSKRKVDFMSKFHRITVHNIRVQSTVFFFATTRQNVRFLKVLNQIFLVSFCSVPCKYTQSIFEIAWTGAVDMLQFVKAFTMLVQIVKTASCEVVKYLF